MEINPYDNFDNWSCILLSTLQCSQDYIDLIADCIDLMFSIISENQLPEPITSYTSKFLNQVIPEATTSLLKNYQIKEDEIETCISFLSTCLTLCTWGVQNNIESLFKLPPQILDQYKFFYHQRKENWKTIMDNFLSSGDMNLICDLMMSTDPFPPLNIYLLVSQIILVFFKDNLHDNAISYVEKFITAIGNYLHSIMDLQIIRNIDKNSLDNILSDFYRILADTSFDHIFDLSSFYEFLEFCYKSDILFIQLFITNSFHYFLIYARDEIILQFSEWCNNKDFIKFLISKDFNEEIIKQIVPIFEILADKDLLNRNTLYILWNRTLHVHTSLRSSYINLIARILRNMKSDDAKNYLAKIMINGSKDIKDSDMIFLENESNNNIPIDQESSSFNELQKNIDSNDDEIDNNNIENDTEFNDENISSIDSDLYRTGDGNIKKDDSYEEPSLNNDEVENNNEKGENYESTMQQKDISSNNEHESALDSNKIVNNDEIKESASNSNDVASQNNIDEIRESASNSNEITNNDEIKESTSNSNEVTSKNDNDEIKDTTSNSNEINNNDEIKDSISNSNEITNNDEIIESTSNSNEATNKNDNDEIKDTTSNSNEINNNDEINESNSKSNEATNENESNKVIDFVPNKNKATNGNDKITNQSVSDGINSKSTSDEAYYNHHNYHYEYMSLQKYHEICQQLSDINLDFQLTNDLLQLLLGCLTTSKPHVSYYIITILFEFSKKDAKISNEFKKSISKKWHNKIKMFLFYKCFEQIQNIEEDHHIVSLILPILIKTVGYNYDLGRDFEKSLFDSLPFDRPLIYSIISEYYQGNAKLLPLKRIINMYGGYNGLDDEFWSFMQSLLDTNGISATTDGGFETLKECIDHFDFKKATTKFVYFLKSYYLIINLYEGRLKTEDYYKQIVKGPIIFIKSNEPPIGLDQFFRLLEITENEEVALISRNTILLFTTSYEMFKCNDTIDIIKDIILPKIESKESNPTLIKRYLSVLYDISVSSELKTHLIDYNYPKHSIYDRDIIVLNLIGLSINHKMICDKHDTFTNIQERLKEIYPFLDKERLFFKLNGMLVMDDNNFLDTYKINNNQIVDISVFNSDEFESRNVDTTKNFIPTCPSIFLTEKHFQNLLLSFYNNSELNQIVNQFLNFLPNDPETMNLIGEQEILVSLLLDGSNSYVFQYYLQILISVLKTTNDEEIINQYKNIDFCTFLCDFLKNNENCSYEIISIFRCLFTIDLNPIINDIIKIVCNILSAEQMNLLGHSLSETKYISSQLFYTILSKFPEINIFVENPSLLESVVSHATLETWQLIRNGLFCLTDVIPLFDKLLDHIERGNNSRYFAELFTAFVPRVSNECNVSKILDMCVDLLTSQAVFEDNQSLISFCEMTSSILNSNKEIEINHNLDTVISKTLPIALKTDDKNIQSAIYDLCTALAAHVLDGQEEINQIMKSVYQIQTDRWNYKPDNFTKSSTGFVGLTNLGATCYMNSVLQQLFYFRTFRDSVFKESFESAKEEAKESFLEFKKIFAHLLLSKKSFAETRPFCNVWIGWSKKTINVREQQDAVEFLNMFLDQLPETLQKSYQGTIINKIEGISEDFKSSNDENFFALSLEIKNFSTIEESFENFLQDELFIGENQIYADTLEHKIDARKYSRIQKAPPVLILHLKRFGYDIKSFIRNKIYSRFVIPQTINIKKLLEKEEEMLYQLKGVVVHFGNANGGHYTSIIKINNKLYDFNDMNVSDFNENDFENETFGGNQMSNCAYLLFYERININENENEIDIESESQLIPSQIKEEIEKENDEFIRCQIAFTKPTMHFASYCNDVQLMTDYFINIFVHSELGDESHIIVERLNNCIFSNSKQKWYINHLNEIFNPKIEEFFLNCSNEEIINSFIEIICKIIDDSNIKLETNENENEIQNNELVFNIDAELILSLFNFSNMIMNYVSSIKQWRQYKYIFTIPYYLLKKCNLSILLKNVYQRTELNNINNIIVRDKENQENIITDKIDISSWSKIITDIIYDFYKETNSEVVLENVDFSKALKICQQVCPIGEESLIMDYYNKIILSKANIISFFVFALKTKQSKFDLESGFTYFYNDNFSHSDSNCFIQYSKNVLTLTDFNCKFYLFNSDHISQPNELLSMFHKQISEKNNLRLRTNLINNYSNYVFPFLISDFSIYTRETAAHLTVDLFPKLMTIDEIGRSYRYSHNNYNNDEIVSPNEKQIEELRLIWNQLSEQAKDILNEPTKYITNFNNNTDKKFNQNDFRCLQFFYVMKWLKLFLDLSDQKEFDIFMNLFNSFHSLNISNNTNLPVLADIITSYPTDYWINESYYIIFESLTNLNISISNKHFQQILNIIEKLPDEKIDEIFNNYQCLEILVNFFKIQNCIANYNTFPFVKKYIARNPTKIDRFCVIFDDDNFKPDSFHENMNCILNIPGVLVPFDVSFAILFNIIKYITRYDLHIYECRYPLEIFSNLKRSLNVYEERLSTDFDFKIIDVNSIDRFVEIMNSFSYSPADIEDLVELVCIDKDVRKDFYEVFHRILSQQYQYYSTFQTHLDFYIKIIKKYKGDDQEFQNEINFIADQAIKTIEGKSVNNFLLSKIYDLIIESENKETMKKVMNSILRHINILRKYDSAFEPFVIQMLQLIGFDDTKLLVIDYCNFIGNNQVYSEDDTEMHYFNLAIIIEVFPDILQLIKNDYPSIMPGRNHYLTTRISNAYYPNEG